VGLSLVTVVWSPAGSLFLVTAWVLVITIVVVASVARRHP